MSTICIFRIFDIGDLRSCQFRDLLIIDKGQLASVTTIDLSKAFDSVDHDVLLMKLAWYGIPSHWFRSYLSGRGQMVRGGCEIRPVRFGVPQGSILGPILFSVVVADLPCFLSHGHLVCYADDTQLLDSSPPDSDSLLQLKIRLQKTLTSVHNWFKTNSLKMNASKTDFILLGTKSTLRKANKFTFSFCNNSFESSNTIRMLGVTVDQLGESGAGSPPLSLAGVIAKLMKRESKFLLV